MRELESSLQEFGEFLLKAQLARPAAAPYFVRWVRRFLSRPASDQPLASVSCPSGPSDSWSAANPRGPIEGSALGLVAGPSALPATRP